MNMTTTNGQPVRVVADAAPLSDSQLAQLGLDEVSDGQSQRWLLLHIRRAALMGARSLTQYAQRRKSATAGAFARALDAAARALVEV